MRGHWLLLVGLAHAPSAAAQRSVGSRSADPEIDFLLTVCEENPQAIVPQNPRVGPPKPLCGSGYFEGLLKKIKTPQRYRQWSFESGHPCHDRWYGVYCNSAGRVTSLSLSDLNLRQLPDVSGMVHLEVLNVANNMELLRSAALPLSVWGLPRLTKLCLSPVGPLDCAIEANSRASLLLTLKGTRPDPYTAPQSLCVGTHCPSVNQNYRVPSILPPRQP